jgi:hypothetical protein
VFRPLLGMRTEGTAMKTIASLTAALALLAASGATAQTWPDKPIRILVGFAAGGPADIGNTPAEFAKVIETETPQWAR